MKLSARNSSVVQNSVDLEELIEASKFLNEYSPESGHRNEDVCWALLKAAKDNLERQLRAMQLIVEAMS